MAKVSIVFQDKEDEIIEVFVEGLDTSSDDPLTPAEEACLRINELTRLVLDAVPEGEVPAEDGEG